MVNAAGGRFEAGPAGALGSKPDLVQQRRKACSGCHQGPPLPTLQQSEFLHIAPFTGQHMSPLFFILLAGLY